MKSVTSLAFLVAVGALVAAALRPGRRAPTAFTDSRSPCRAGDRVAESDGRPTTVGDNNVVAFPRGAGPARSHGQVAACLRSADVGVAGWGFEADLGSAIRPTRTTST
jgi:hypothetical protein